LDARCWPATGHSSGSTISRISDAKDVPGAESVCIVVGMHAPRLLKSATEFFARYSKRPIRKFALFGLVAALQISGADPRVGNWKLVSAQSTLNPPNTLSITPLEHNQVHVVMTGANHIDFTAKSDGHETAVPGNPAFDQVILRRIDKTQSEVTEKKNGAVVATVHDKVAKDGNELTITTTSVGHPDDIAVWTRSGGVKVASNPSAGEWTQDLSKSRLRQALPLKIEEDGSGAVKFSYGYSYTARFDGKPYDVKNSPNDTVTLQLVDPLTVDAIFRRDDQVTQNDRWVVSVDRQKMTLTSTGTLETGQRFNEKLVFQKQ
jgi:hypothetical protein